MRLKIWNQKFKVSILDQDDVEGIKDISVSTHTIADDDVETSTIESIEVDIRTKEPVE